jgi:hypothetical protein
MRLPIQFPNSLSGDAVTTGMGGRGASPIGIGGSGRSRSGIRLRAENTSLSWSAGDGWGAAPEGCGSTVARTPLDVSSFPQALAERDCELRPLHGRRTTQKPNQRHCRLLRPHHLRPRHRRADKQPEDIPASHGAPPGFEDALRLRGGSLGIKEFCGRGSCQVSSAGLLSHIPTADQTLRLPQSCVRWPLPSLSL